MPRCRFGSVFYLAAGSATLFAASVALRLHPDVFDRPVARSLNQFAAESGVGSRLAAAVTQPVLQGVAVVSLAWACWFYRPTRVFRDRIVVGAAAAVLAALAAHFVQASLPPVVKPIFDAGLTIRTPNVLGSIEVLRSTANPLSQSFPSERATLFAGLAIGILSANRGIGLVALGGSVGVELCRIYLGLHYPSDAMGSVFLAGTVVWLVQAVVPRALGGLFVAWERRSAATFYMAGFAASYLLATALEDMRPLLGWLLG
jgi:membrane-associated phospholipid phosphatase